MSDSEYPLISVALCTYNGEQFIAEQLRSILNQSWPNLEVLIFDDRSTDATVSVIQNIAAIDARVQLRINAQRLGVNFNFSRAFSACCGMFIAPSDQDDIWHFDKLMKLYTALGDADLAYCDSQYVDSTGRPMEYRMSSMRRMCQGNDPLRFVFTNSISGHALLARASLAKTLHKHPAVPYDWGLAIAAAGNNGVVYVHEPLVQFRRHQNTSTTLGRSIFGLPPSAEKYWAERKSILEFIAEFGDRRRVVAKKLATALQRWRSGGSKLPFFIYCVRYAVPLFWIMSRKPMSFIRGALRQIKP